MAFSSRTSHPALLCVANYPSNTGYAWDFIESLYAQLAARLAPLGVRTFVAYPKITSPPRTLDGSPAVAVSLDARLGTRQSALATVRFAREHGVRAIYLTDRPVRSLLYAAVRAVGVRSIIVHDHSSGERAEPKGMRRVAKYALSRTPLIGADVVIAVSGYVARRQLRVGMMPPHRVIRVWNGLAVPPAPPPEDRRLHVTLGVDSQHPIVACACRCAPEKGVPTLLRAFDLVITNWRSALARPFLVYMGDGPEFAEVQRTREGLNSRDYIILTGYRPDAAELLAGADVCAMPSVWADALPLAVMQPMALGRAVVASDVGGIPEMIIDGTSGLLVPPRDETALAAALTRLLQEPDFAAALGRAARARIAEHFTPERQLNALTTIVSNALGESDSSRPPA